MGVPDGPDRVAGSTYSDPAATDELVSESLIAHETSPVIDREGPGFTITESTSPVIFLSHARRRALVTAAASGKRHILLTGERTSITPAYAELASMLGGVWVVASKHGFRDAKTGRRLRSPENAITAEGGAEKAEEFARPPVDESTIVTITASIRQRNRKRAEYGASTQLLAELLVEGVKLRWGTQEPVMMEWHQETVREFVRERLERTPWLLFAGEGPQGNRVAGSLRVRPTKQGSEEILTITANVGPKGSDEAADVLADLPDMLAELVSDGIPLMALAFATIDRGDLLQSSTLKFPSIPMAMLVGAPGVAKFEYDLDMLTDEFDAFVAGPERREAIVFSFGETTSPENLVELRDVVISLDPESLAAEFGDGFMAGLLGANWREGLEKYLAEIEAEVLGDDTETSDESALLDELEFAEGEAASNDFESDTLDLVPGGAHHDDAIDEHTLRGPVDPND